MNILITGAGLIAAGVGRELQSRGESVKIYDLAPSIEYLDTVLDTHQAQIFTGDITDVEKIAAIVRDQKIDSIVHTAGLIGATISRQPYRGVEVNVGGSIAVIEAARQANVNRIVFSSSMAVYDFGKLPSQALVTEQAVCGPKNLYGATKLASEYLLTQYGNLYDIDVVHLRLAGVYGRGQYFGGSWMGMVLNRLLEASLAGREVVLQPEWIGTNEYVYVKDAAQAFAQGCLSKERIGGIYNIGSGVLYTYAEVVNEIRDLVPNTKIQVIEGSSSIVSYLVRDQAFDISKAGRMLGYSPQFNLRTGLQDYLKELAVFRGKYPTLS